jgi:hypothetical protein
MVHPNLVPKYRKLSFGEVEKTISQYSDYAMGLTIWDLNPSRGKRFFSSPNSPDWFWDPPSLYSVGTGVLYQGVKLLSLMHTTQSI